MIRVNQAGAVNAYLVFEKLYKQKMKPATAFSVFILRKTLKEQYDFQVEQEKIIISNHGGIFDKDGNVSFETEEKYHEAEKELKELADNEIQIDLNPINILQEDILISPEDIQKIQPFIIF